MVNVGQKIVGVNAALGKIILECKGVVSVSALMEEEETLGDAVTFSVI